MIGLSTDLKEGDCFRTEVGEPFLRVTKVSLGKKIDRIRCVDIQSGKKVKLELAHPRLGDSDNIVGLQIQDIENAQRMLREEQE